MIDDFGARVYRTRRLALSAPGRDRQADPRSSTINKKNGYRQQNVRQRQKLISIIDYDVCIFVLYASIFEIFNVKEWPDLEIWVWGPSRSLKNARFNRTCMTFY